MTRTRPALAARLALAGCGGAGVVTAPRPAGPPVPVRIPAVTQQTVIGHSVRGRPIVAVRLGDLRAAHPVLVVGAIHGNEPAGIAVARLLIRRAAPGMPALVVVPDSNPDGVAADTRQNADGVDLNRNFPYGWRMLSRHGDQQYQGPRPLSEPESRAMRRLIIELRPGVTVWFHQPLGLVDRSGGDPAVEDRLAALVGLPVRQLRATRGVLRAGRTSAFPAPPRSWWSCRRGG